MKAKKVKFESRVSISPLKKSPINGMLRIAALKDAMSRLLHHLHLRRVVPAWLPSH